MSGEVARHESTAGAASRLAAVFRPRERLERDRTTKPASADPPLRPEYGAGRHWEKSRVWLIVLAAGYLLWTFLVGGFFSLTAPYFIVPLAAPIAVLLLICIWALPQLAAVPTRTMRVLFFAYLVTLVVWPNYLAVALPGLPWITLTRISVFPMAILLLISLAGSREVRRSLAEALRAQPLIWQLLAAFVVIQTLTLPMSAAPMRSANLYLQAQVTWTGVFFVSCLLFLRPGLVRTWAILLWATAIFVCMLGLWEYRLQHVPWEGHVPGFLKIEDPNVARMLAGEYRLGGDYRIKSTFSTSLGFGEYIALSLPFVIHFAINAQRFAVRALAAGSALFMLAMAVLSGTRLATVSCLLTLLLYVFLIAFRAWRNRRGGPIAPAIVLGYPVILVLTIASVFLVGHVRHMVLGNGSAEFSTDARKDQYSLGLPMVLHDPVGHGIGQGGDVLGYAPMGFLTIDTYYLSVLLEYGVAGFIVYYGMFGVGVFEAGRRALFSNLRGDEAFLAPLALALINFVVIKSVFSQQDNHPLVFMMLGIVVALLARGRASAKAPLATNSATRVPASPTSRSQQPAPFVLQR